MSDQWYYCGLCGFEFPQSELRDHKYHKKWPTDSQTEESNQDEEKKDS